VRTLPLFASFLLFAAVLACGGEEVSAPATQALTSVSTPRVAATLAPTLAASTPGAPVSPAETQPTTAPSQATGLPSSVSLQRLFPDLSFERMTGLYQLPSGAWLVTEQPGRVSLIDRAGTQASILLDLADNVRSDGNEEGLLGLAIALDFVETGVIYLHYSASNPRRGVISRFHVGPDGAGEEGEEIILEIRQPFSNHNGGQIAFGPDGYLYVGLGDGGSARDPQGNGQNLETVLGSLLRLDVSGGGAGYSVPADNPFVGQGDARGEVWAYGLRNPWRFSFDAATGDLWAGDVGQNTREEVDLILRGGNYGWPIMEGLDCLDGGSGCDRAGLLLPVVDYANSGGECSVTGGYVYHGSIAALQGAYVYADYCSGRIWALRHDGSAVSVQAQIAQVDFNVSSFAQGNDLEVYVLEHSGSGGIYKLLP